MRGVNSKLSGSCKEPDMRGRRKALFACMLWLLMLATPFAQAQWYTEPDHPPRTFPATDLGELIADSTGGAYFFSVFGVADANVMHVQINGEWDLAFPGLYLGGRGTINPVGSIVDSENNFVIVNQYFWGDMGGPRLPNHLVKVTPTGDFLWDYALPDTNTFINTMVKGEDGRVLIETKLRVPDSASHWYDFPRYLQIFESSGTPVFDWDEVPLAEETAAGSIFLSDGTGGAIYAWVQEAENGSYELRLQRIDPTGNLLYGSEGMCVPVQGLRYINSMRDGFLNDFLVSYRDSIQNRWGWARVNFEGDIEWSVLNPAEYQTGWAWLPDKHGGLFLVRENRALLGRMNRQGEFAFEPIPYDTGYGDCYMVSLTSGLNVLWRRPDSAWVLQRYDTLGHRQWANPVVVFDLPPAEWIQHKTIACDNAGGTIIAFYRPGGPREERGWYFTRVDAEGILGSSVFVPERDYAPREFRVTAYPNPFNSATTLTLSCRQRHRSGCTCSTSWGGQSNSGI